MMLACLLKQRHLFVAMFVLFSMTANLSAAHPNAVVYEGDKGPGKGKHVVLIAGDEEYRSEETCPALGRILAKHYGFKCTVLFTTDEKTGFIEPRSSHITGMEAIDTADLLIVFLRFRDFPEEQMQHLVDYVDAGGPIVGLRTSTHAFNIRKGRPFAHYSHQYPGEEFKKGFGRQILGETWAGHYGNNHRTTTAFHIEADYASHAVMRGVKDIWVQSGAYVARPLEGSMVLAKSQVLAGLKPTSPPQEGKDLQPAAWLRTYLSSSRREGRVFASTHGTSEDIVNDGFRRMLVNSCLWCAGLEDSIKADGPIGFVGPFNPVTFSFGGFRKGVKPSDLAGWDSPIMSKDASTEQPKR